MGGKKFPPDFGSPLRKGKGHRSVFFYYKTMDLFGINIFWVASRARILIPDQELKWVSGFAQLFCKSGGGIQRQIFGARWLLACSPLPKGWEKSFIRPGEAISEFF